MTTATKLILSSCTYRKHDCTSRGWDIDFYAGPNDEITTVLTYHTCWQGEFDGTTYRATPPAEVQLAVRTEVEGGDHGLNPDVDAAIANWLQSADPSDWVRIRRGSRVGG